VPEPIRTGTWGIDPTSYQRKPKRATSVPRQTLDAVFIVPNPARVNKLLAEKPVMLRPPRVEQQTGVVELQNKVTPTSVRGVRSTMASINIKNDELVAKIRLLAQRRQLGITATLNELIDRELATPEDTGTGDDLVQYWLEIGRRNRQRNPNAPAADQIDELLYDEMGLPK